MQEKSDADSSDWQFAAEAGNDEKSDSGRAADTFAGKSSESSGQTGGFSGETEKTGWVHVCGCVAVPGVYEIREGMRVCEVLEMAGGMTAAADRECLNLAQPVTDGEKIRVPSREETAGTDPGIIQGTEARSGGSGKIDLNRAGREELMTLPGIGRVKAEAILAYREEHGPFSRAEDLCKVPGIKEATYTAIADLIMVS